jgi:hypothetical protein
VNDTPTATLPSASTVTPPGPGPNDQAAFSCWSASYAYSTISSQISSESEVVPYTSAQFFPTFTTTDCCYRYSPTLSTTTLCDGYPRVLSIPEDVYNVTKTSTLYNYTLSTQGSLPSHTEVLPSCTVDVYQPACTKIWSNYDYTSASLKSASGAYDSYGLYAQPPCPSPVKVCPSAATVCSMELEEPTMYYWPVTTTSGDFCAHNGTTVTPSPTDPPAPDTTEIGDMTFTSPSVYIVAQSAYAWYKTSGHGLISYGRMCGHVETSATYTIAQESISTMYVHEKGTHYSMDWDDLNTIRHEAYQRACGRRYGCSSFTDIVSSFTPLVVLPDEIRTEEANWNGCNGEAYFRPKMVELGGRPRIDDEDGDDDDDERKAKNAKAKITAPARVDAASTSTMRTFDPEATTKQVNVKHLEFVEEVQILVLDGGPRRELRS